MRNPFNIQFLLKLKSFGNFRMAKSTFEYVKSFELEDKILPNTWIVVRVDGKCFHKFSEDHKFEKPNDIRALHLMNYAAYKVMGEIHDIVMAFGQSDEYSFIFKKNTKLYNRREAKLLTTVNSKFTSSYVYYWNKFFNDDVLQYPPTFDGRIITYPSDENLVDYMKWRQADVHINNLYNTTFWQLILKGNLSPAEAEKRLCGTVSADKNEILFHEFNMNYNNEPTIFKRGTCLMRKSVESNNFIVDMHDDMLKDKFWKEHHIILNDKYKNNMEYHGPISSIISEQLLEKENKNKT